MKEIEKLKERIMKKVDKDNLRVKALKKLIKK